MNARDRGRSLLPGWEADEPTDFYEDNAYSRLGLSRASLNGRRLRPPPDQRHVLTRHHHLLALIDQPAFLDDHAERRAALAHPLLLDRPVRPDGISGA